MNNSSLVELCNIRLLYGHKKIFENFNFKIEHREKWLVFGNNGSGKTSLLKLVAQLYSPTEGEVTWRTEDSLKTPRVNYVSASAKGLFNHLTGEENIKAIRKIRGTTDQSGVTLRDFEDFHNFNEALKTPFCECSMGMKKLLTIAASLLFPAHLYIFDEPFLHLDSENQILLSKLLEKLNISILIASPEKKELQGFNYKCLS